LFLQWVQAYEIDGKTLRTVYATCHSVFPQVETWQTQAGDLLLLGSLDPVRHDAAELRQRIAQEPYRTALANVWRVTNLEGFLGHHIANAAFAEDVARVHDGDLNTDDKTVVEFGFARSVGVRSGFSPGDVLRLAQDRKQDRPAVTGGDVDWEAVGDQRVAMNVYEGRAPIVPPDADTPLRTRAQAMQLLLQGNAAGAIQTWRQQPRPPSNLIQVTYLATALTETASPEAEQYIERIRQVQPTEAEALLANLRWRQHRPLESAVALQTAFTRYRTDPWPHTDLMRRTIELAVNVARGDQQGNVARVLFDSLSAPFCLHLNQDLRLRALVMISSHLDSVTGSMLLPDAVAKFEPHVPWEEPFLFVRFNAYDRAGHRLRERAMDDLNEFRENQPFAFDDHLKPQPTTKPTTGPASGPATMPWIGPANEGLLGPVQETRSSGSAPAPAPQPQAPASPGLGGTGGGAAAPPPPSPSQSTPTDRSGNR